MNTAILRLKFEPLIRVIFICTLITLFVSTIPSPLSAEDNAATDMKTKIGQMLLVGFRGLAVDKNSPIINDIKAGRIGGVILFDYDVPSASPIRNIKSPEQVKKLVSDLQVESDIPLFIAIDQEGGKVCRLKESYGFPPSVSAQYLGALDNVETTKKYADTTAHTLAHLGINLNFAPVVDLNTNPGNPVIGGKERSFSADPAVVTRHAIAVIDSLHTYGVLSAIKHFPGHGSSTADSHEGFVDVTKTWSQEELIPYDNIFKAGRCDMIMTAHVFNKNLDPRWPATLSLEVMHILRDYMGYDGVIVSDDMQMKAISQSYGFETAIEWAILAGVDILIFANNSVFEEDVASRAVAIIEKMLADGKIPGERIDSSYRRIMKLKDRLTQ